MPLPSPNLDDRDFRQLVEEARSQIARSCPGWTDLSPGDPGVVLLEVFAYLTDTMIYRLNQLPEKAFVEFLRLIGVRLQPPAAAAVTLRFSRARADDRPISIPRGTRVTVGRATAGSEPPVFATADTATIRGGATEVDVLAFHGDLVNAELAGIGTGLPGLSLSVRQPPIVAPTGDGRDLIVGIEATPDELDAQAVAIEFESKAYRVWREVSAFTEIGADPHVYVVDRLMGIITFAPAARMVGADGTLEPVPSALAAVPASGREIRFWYRRGGGTGGNLAAETLTILRDPIGGVQVTNPAPATGGRDAETLDNALVRGPQDLHSFQRAVTARDFEAVALRSSGAVARAKAITRADLWVHAVPGTVEVLLVPQVSDDAQASGLISAEELRNHATSEARAQVQTTLDERRPLGTTCIVNWARLKTVRVRARIVVNREEDAASVQQRVLERLQRTITPLPTSRNPTGWGFGEALRVSQVYRIAQAEPGVRYVDRVRLVVDEVPDAEVAALAADTFQPRTWYAGSGAILYRSLDDGDGWEPAGRFDDGPIALIRAHPTQPGLIAVATKRPDGTSTSLRVSQDCGETWTASAQLAFEVEGLDWLIRDDQSVLLLATDRGLFELGLRADAGPVPLLVDPAAQDKGFYTVAVASDVRGVVSVAVAARENGGVYLSTDGGRAGTFRKIGLDGEDIRLLTVRADGVRTFLWAGVTAASSDDPGKGCYRRELVGTADSPEGWVAIGAGWRGGSCRGLAFVGTSVIAATYHAGVMRLEAVEGTPTWKASPVNCGLPLRDPGRFQRLDAITSDPAGRLVLAGGPAGVFRSTDGGVTYQTASSHEFTETVTLPGTWLFCSGEHEINVEVEDAPRGD